MRKRSLVLLAGLLLSTTCLIFAGQTGDKAPSGNNLLGDWAGTWTGGSTGKFEMTISKDTTGKIDGSLTAKPAEGEGWTVKFKSIEGSNNKYKMKLEDPGGESEVSLEVTIDGKEIKGTYSVSDKAKAEVVETGTVTATKK